MNKMPKYFYKIISLLEVLKHLVYKNNDGHTK